MDYNQVLNIENICGGAVAERFERALGEVLRNIADPNHPAEKPRVLTLEFHFDPFKDRSGALVSLVCKTKLPGVDEVPGSIFFAKEGLMLKAYAHDPRQENMFGTDASINKKGKPEKAQ